MKKQRWKNNNLIYNVKMKSDYEARKQKSYMVQVGVVKFVNFFKL